MTVYHGSENHNLKLFKWKCSRYGFPILFCSTDKDLAKSYADSWKDKFQRKNSFLYELEIPDSTYEIDYKNQDSYTPDFRNLIYQLRKENKPIVKFQNIIDYPNENFKTDQPKDVIAIYDLDLISSMKPVS